MPKEFIRIVTEDTVEMITDDTLREMKSHGTADFPFQYYIETFDWKRREFIEWHWHNEIEFVHLEVRVDNEKAYNLYSKMGF